MEEPKEISNNKNAEQLDVYNVASPRQHVKKDIAEKLYQVLSFSESSIIQDIDKCKRREWKKQHIKNVEKDLRETVNHELPMKSITKRDWYGRQTSRIDVGTDKKRWHNRLNKGRMDLEYSKQVHAELLLPKKPIDGGAQELNCVNIKCMERELEEISSLRKKAYKCAYKHGDQQNEVKSSYTEYQSLMKYVKELARRGDTRELMKICHRQLFEVKERPNEPEMSYNNVAYSPRQQVKKDIAESLYQVLSFYESGKIQEIKKCKKDEIRINNDVMWFSSCDKLREWKKQHMQNVEKDLGEVDHELPMTSVPRTDIDVGTDKKRCNNRLNKGRMDLEYSKEVQEELLISKKWDKRPIDGAQELNYVLFEGCSEF
ncbi:hypothetical protein Tco_0950471 [Tanacetum coccineum]